MKKIVTPLLLLLLMNDLQAQFQQLYEKKEFIRGNDTLQYRTMHLPNRSCCRG